MIKTVSTLPETSSISEKPLTRRQLLRTMAVSSVALAGGATLAACGSSGPATVKVTFYTAAWPTDIMPTTAQQKADPAMKAYADTLQKWLNQNPGVTIKHNTMNIWGAQYLVPAITAGTGPTWFMGDILGNFTSPAIRSAYTRGLAADVTDLVSSYGIEGQMTTEALPVYQALKVNNRYYGSPGGYGVGDGIFFRRDLIQAAGLQEPQPSWTWTDFRALAKALTQGKTKGAALQNYIFSQSVAAQGLVSGPTSYGSLGLIPSPSTGWPWRFDITSHLNEYQKVVDNWRGMYYDDKSLLADPAYGDSDVSAAFIRGDAAMMADNTSYLTRALSDPYSVVHVSTNLNKPFDDTVGWITQPRGTNGHLGATQPGMVLGSIDPHLQRKTPLLDKAFSFMTYMLTGQGAVDMNVNTYKVTKNLKQLFNNLPPMTKNMASFPGISQTAVDAWGPKMMAAIDAAGKMPIIPDSAIYFPPEKNSGPTNDAVNDAVTGMNNSHNSVSSILNTLQNTFNQQVTSLNSSVSQADFLHSAKTYFTALDAFWKKATPDYYANVFHPWYEKTILPLLNG